MELDKNIEQEIAGLLADPEKVSVQHTAMLNDLLQEYPYYQPLHLLLAKASQHAEKNNALAKASLYTNGKTLHRFLFEKRDIRTNFQLNEVYAAIGADLQVVTDEEETFEEISEPVTVASHESSIFSQQELLQHENSASADVYPAIAEEELNSETSYPAAAKETLERHVSLDDENLVADEGSINTEDPAAIEEEFSKEEKYPATAAADDHINNEDPAKAQEEFIKEEEYTTVAGENPVIQEEHFHLNDEDTAEEADNEAERSPVRDEQETFEEISETLSVARPENKVPDGQNEVAKDHSPATDDQETFEEISENLSVAQAENTVPDEQALRSSDLATDEQETFEEISESPAFQTVPPPTEQDIPAEEISAGVEDNIFEEIGEVDYETYRPFRNNIQSVPAENTVSENSDAGHTERQQLSWSEPHQTEPAIPEEARDEETEETAQAEPEQSGNDAAELIENIQNERSATARPEEARDEETEETAQAEPESGIAAAEQKETLQPQKSALEDDFVFESIVSTDFFAFENNFSSVEEVEPEKPEVPAPPIIEEHDEAAATEVANSTVSNYNDDKLPYTFLWWLAKTRKEHQSSFQPYAAVKKPGSQELQQQYVEHIFHLQSHLTNTEELLDSEEPPKPVSKDFQIIDSFIKNDPQIHPPKAEQIDNENKAKRSAEDQNDLVSETLAGIYIEQMLYDKAIDTYEKLSLKFPEKSRYFADLIQSIEKKI